MTETINPFNLKKLNSYPFLSDNELETTLKQVNKTYNTWKKTSLKERKTLGYRFAKILEKEKENLATCITLEMGKPITESYNEVDKCIMLVDYFCENMDAFLAPKHIDNKTYLEYNSTGAILGVMPWNFPLWQVFRYAIPCIMGGNVVLLKHAPNCFGTAQKLEKLFVEAGFSKNIFTNLIIDTSQVEKVVANSAVQGVCVTGSTKSGSIVASLASKYLKKSVLELGGTDACVLFKDADFNKALTATFKARMLNAGQVCIAPKRIFIPQEWLSKTVDFIKSKMSEIKLGDPLDTNTTMGPIAKADFLPILQKQVNKAINLGANLIVGGKAKTPFFEPTLLVFNIDNAALKEEIFGPVICLIPYNNKNDLLESINNTNYGLGTALWTKDIAKARKWATEIEAGYVSINKIVKSDVKYPFGGVKNSGYGKELGEQGFKTFLNCKTVTS